MFTRRHILSADLSAPLAYAACSFVPVWAQNAPNFGTPSIPSPGVRKMEVDHAEVLASNAMVGGFHFPFPAFGRTVASGNGYAFQLAA